MLDLHSSYPVPLVVHQGMLTIGLTYTSLLEPAAAI